MTNTSQKQEQQRVTTNPNPTYKSLSEVEELSEDLEQARIQITALKSERDSIAGTVNNLDKEVANLKDKLGKEQQLNENLLKTFQDLYARYQDLYDQIITSNTALTITTGKLSESLVRCKFTIPQQEQQQA